MFFMVANMDFQFPPNEAGKTFASCSKWNIWSALNSIPFMFYFSYVFPTCLLCYVQVSNPASYSSVLLLITDFFFFLSLLIRAVVHSFSLCPFFSFFHPLPFLSFFSPYKVHIPSCFCYDSCSILTQLSWSKEMMRHLKVGSASYHHAQGNFLESFGSFFISWKISLLCLTYSWNCLLGKSYPNI